MKVKVKSLSRVRLFATPWTVAYQAPQSMEFSRQAYWSGLPFPSPGIFPTQGSNPGLPHCRPTLYYLNQREVHSFKRMGINYYKTLLLISCKVIYEIFHYIYFPGGSDGKASVYNEGDLGSSPGLGISLEKEMAIHSSTIAWKIPWTEEPGRLQCMGSQRVGHD